jgi:hypothetical protein
MTSNVTNYSALINTAFPVPGADNDTQGFRDNFGNIATALTTASMEISDLQIIQSSLISLASAAPSTPKGQAGDIQGQIFATTSTLYICTSNYVGTTTNIWAKIVCTPW